MTQMTDATWSPAEEVIALAAFQKAFERERNALLSEVRQRAGTISQLDDLWQLNDFLSARRHAMDGKYDYRDATLLFVFAQLVKEGWLHLDDLQGIESSKLTKISALARM
jgi:hypothetical protein